MVVNFRRIRLAVLIEVVLMEKMIVLLGSAFMNLLPERRIELR